MRSKICAPNWNAPVRNLPVAIDWVATTGCPQSVGVIVPCGLPTMNWPAVSFSSSIAAQSAGWSTTPVDISSDKAVCSMARRSTSILVTVAGMVIGGVNAVACV